MIRKGNELVLFRAVIANRLLALRQRSGERQSDVAVAIGIAPGALSQYETGRREPSLAALIALARHYDVRLSRIVTEKD